LSQTAGGRIVIAKYSSYLPQERKELKLHQFFPRPNPAAINTVCGPCDDAVLLLLYCRKLLKRMLGDVMMLMEVLEIFSRAFQGPI
jgi:hypothetical protein